MVGTNCHDQCVQADGGIMYNSYLYTYTRIATCSYMKAQVTKQ